MFFLTEGSWLAALMTGTIALRLTEQQSGPGSK